MSTVGGESGGLRSSEPKPIQLPTVPMAPPMRCRNPVFSATLPAVVVVAVRNSIVVVVDGEASFVASVRGIGGVSSTTSMMMPKEEALLPLRSESIFGILPTGVDQSWPPFWFRPCAAFDHSRNEDCVTKSFGDKDARKKSYLLDAGVGPLNPVTAMNSAANRIQTQGRTSIASAKSCYIVKYERKMGTVAVMKLFAVLRSLPLLWSPPIRNEIYCVVVVCFCCRGSVRFGDHEARPIKQGGAASGRDPSSSVKSHCKAS